MEKSKNIYNRSGKKVRAGSSENNESPDKLSESTLEMENFCSNLR